jgi:hypothetical protein
LQVYLSVATDTAEDEAGRTAIEEPLPEDEEASDGDGAGSSIVTDSPLPPDDPDSLDDSGDGDTDGPMGNVGAAAAASVIEEEHRPYADAEL